MGIYLGEAELVPAMPRKLNLAERERERLHRQAYGMRSPEEVPRRGDLARFVLPPLSLPTPVPDPFSAHAGSLSSNTSPANPSHPAEASGPVAAAPSSSSPTSLEQPTPEPATSISEPSAQASVSPSSESLPAAARPQPAASKPAETAERETAETAAAAAAAAPAPFPESMGSSTSTSNSNSSQAWCNFPVSLPLLSLHPLFERASAYYSRSPRGLSSLQ
ncbi:hypothetical protein DUNSADRAFT_4809, partial [Dunaliella salina]